MRRFASFFVLLTAGGLLALMPGLVQARAHAAPHTCSGTPSSPGVLSGNYPSGVVVSGACAVNNGPAHVVGSLTLNNGSVLIAAFGMKGSRLSVSGNVTVGQGATFLLGCNTTSFPCVDDPNQSAPTLTSPGNVTGNITENAPLGVIVHSSTIGGSITETGGGGGVNCNPTGPFAAFQSPVFSDYEDNTITGGVTITQVTSCWLGVIRNHIGKSLTISNNSMADPDAIEIEKNVIKRNLVCRRNKQHVWDSADSSPTGALYPRSIGRNKVGHYREGQCLTATPLTPDGVPAGGPF
jgi:hypothetical protein